MGRDPVSTRNIASEAALSNGSVEEHTVERREDRALENRPMAERAGHGRLPHDGEVFRSRGIRTTAYG